MVSKQNALRAAHYHPARYALKLLRWELRQHAEFVRWIFRRKDIPAGSFPIPYHRTQLQLASWMSVLIVVEIVVVHLLLPTFILQVIAAVVSVYSLALLWAVIASRAVRPHLVSKEQLVLRYGRRIVATVPTINMASVRVDRMYDGDWWVVTDAVLTLGCTEGTNLTIELCAPQPVLVNSYPWQKDTYRKVSQIRLWADDLESPAVQVLVGS